MCTWLCCKHRPHVAHDSMLMPGPRRSNLHIRGFQPSMVVFQGGATSARRMEGPRTLDRRDSHESSTAPRPQHPKCGGSAATFQMSTCCYCECITNIYIYIYREREIERESDNIYIYIYIYVYIYIYRERDVFNCLAIVCGATFQMKTSTGWKRLAGESGCAKVKGV